MAEDLQIERIGPSALRISGEVDLANAEELGSALEGIESANSDVELNLEGLTFIDSTGLREIILLARKLPEGRSLVLIAPTAAIRRTFEIAGIPEIPQVHVRDDADGSG